MKKSGFVAASMAAVSATAYSSSKSNLPNEEVDRSGKNNEKSSSRASSSSSSDRFAPRFDGLRFIETLVTAHR